MGQGVLSSRHPSSGGVGIRQAGRRPPRRCCSPPPSPQRPRCPHPRPGLALAMSSSAWIFCDASTNQLRRRSQARLSSASPLLCGVSGPTARQRWRSAKRAVPPALGRLKKVGATLALYNFRTQWLTSAVSDIPSLAATLIADGVSDQDEVDLFRAVPSSQAAAGSRCWR